MAKLYFRYGAMNCGKTTNLLQSIHNYEERKMQTLLLKPLVDTKGEDKVVSRIGLSKKVDHLIPKEEDLFEYLTTNDEGVDCIFVDEAQFLQREQVDQLLHVVVKDSIPVICYGLRTDFNSNGFPGSIRLLEIAHSIEEMKTICQCGSKATFNARMEDGVFTFLGAQVAIDGSREGDKDVSYVSLCPKCYFREKQRYERERGEKPKVLQKKRVSAEELVK